MAARLLSKWAGCKPAAARLVSSQMNSAPSARISIMRIAGAQNQLMGGQKISLMQTRPVWRLGRSAAFSTAAKLNEKSSPPQATASKPTGPRLPKLIPMPHENIYTLPNLLTFSRLASAPLLGYLILTSQPTAALALFAYAGITDLLDGWIARRWNLKTVVGSVVDPMADKTLVTVVVGALAWQGSLPLYLAVIILGRDVALAISAIYFRYISLPPPKTFARYWDFSLPSAEVRPTEISKWNTGFQLALIGATMAAPVLQQAGWWSLEAEASMVAAQYFVATTTVWSGLSYIGNKDAVKILGREEGKEATEGEKEKS